MDRRRPSTTLAEAETKKKKKGEEKKGVKYAVFMTHGDHVFEIYKLDSVVEGKDDVQELGQPIFSLESSNYPSEMLVFSVGSKIYFSGGVWVDRSHKYAFYEHTLNTYMLDINSDQGIVPVGSLKSVKKYPIVFGPIEGHKFYVFDTNSPASTFEMFSTITNEWETLLLPSFLQGIEINGASVLCGSNILLSHYSYGRPAGGLCVFCTRTGNWRVIPDLDPTSGKPYEIPFLEGPRKSGNWPVISEEEEPEPYELPFYEVCPVFREIKDINVNIFVAMPYVYRLPEVFTSLKLPPGEDHDLVAPIRYEGELDGLKAQLKEVPSAESSWKVEHYFFVSDTSICVIRETALIGQNWVLIDICDLSCSLVEGTKVKIKVHNTSKYKYPYKRPHMMPVHFLVA